MLQKKDTVENEAGMDCWVHDTETGENRVIAKNQGIGGVEGDTKEEETGVLVVCFLIGAVGSLPGFQVGVAFMRFPLFSP